MEKRIKKGRRKMQINNAIHKLKLPKSFRAMQKAQGHINNDIVILAFLYDSVEQKAAYVMYEKGEWYEVTEGLYKKKIKQMFNLYD